MLSQPGSLLPIMFAFLFGFAAIRAEEIPNGIMPQKRQVVGTGVTTSSTPTTSNSPSTSTTPDSSPSTSTIPITSSTPTGQSTSNVPTSDLTSTSADGTTDSTTAAVQTTKGSADANSVVKVGSTTINPKTLSTKTTVREPLVTKATAHKTLTSTWTGADGQVRSSTYVTDSVFQSTTGFATATIAPGLADAGGDGSNLSTNTKKVIGGVVGGIGGAILIGGLAFVAWRLWGKKKDAQELPQEETYSNDSLSAQKRLSNNTLGTYSEPYSNPNGAVNTASNF